jgi:ubiquinone/menaquinone biosynthesis C-methylase UbiE
MLRNYLPYSVYSPLFGDRRTFGLQVKPNDTCWTEWQDMYLKFYYANQKRSIGAIVNDSGYKIMQEVSLSGKTVLEIGPGDIHHISNWRGRPERYVIADIQQAMLDYSASKLESAGIQYKCVLLTDREKIELPFRDAAFDVLVSFYSLEHIYLLRDYLPELVRVLKPGGILIGAIPCEGGIAWGLGRYLTSRRWLKRNTSINPDKLICWEHPNFADEILKQMDNHLIKKQIEFWPLALPSIDLNLVIKFVYTKG